MTDNSLDTSVDETNPFAQSSEEQEAPPSEDTAQPALAEDAESAPEPEAVEPSADEPVVAAPEVTDVVAAPEPEAVPAAEPVAELPQVETEAAVAEADVETSEAEEGEDGEEDDEESGFFFEFGDWYVVHTYAGYENKVRANLSSRIQSMNMEDKIYDVVVPTEEVMELKSGKMQSVQKKVFPGYILVRMELDDDSWYVVRNTPGVTGFVGSGAKPTPLDATEVTKILAPKTEDRPKPKLDYEVGEVVSVVAGPFNGYSGPVNAIDVDKQQVTVLLDLFGRETPVELTFDQVTKL